MCLNISIFFLLFFQSSIVVISWQPIYKCVNGQEKRSVCIYCSKQLIMQFHELSLGNRFFFNMIVYVFLKFIFKSKLSLRFIWFPI